MQCKLLFKYSFKPSFCVVKIFNNLYVYSVHKSNFADYRFSDADLAIISLIPINLICSVRHEPSDLTQILQHSLF